MRTTKLVGPALLLALAACAAPRSDRPRVALVMKSLANEFFKTMEDGARAHQQAHADRVRPPRQRHQGRAGRGRQIRLVEQMIAQGVDAIVIAPADSQGPGGGLQEGARTPASWSSTSTTSSTTASLAQRKAARPLRRARTTAQGRAGRGRYLARAPASRATRWRSSRACPERVQRRRSGKIGFEDARARPPAS